MNTQREIKFRRPYFSYKDDKFSHFSIWGVNIGRSEFVTPSQSSHHYPKGDQQFTGLKDRNGKEIYEGDIVKFNDDRKYYSSVIWKNELTGFYLSSGSLAPLGRQDHELEVIGNIYENLELL